MPKDIEKRVEYVGVNIDLTVDYAFKRIFGAKHNEDLLLELLNDILNLCGGKRLIRIKLINPFNLKNYEKDKVSILDIKAVDNEGTLYDIEIQIKATTDYPKRMLYYASDLYRSQLKEGMSYNELNKVICISFVNDVMIKGTDRYFNRFVMRSKDGIELTDDMSLYVIELPKFNEKLNSLSTPASMWAYLLKNSQHLDFDKLAKEFSNRPIFGKLAKEVNNMKRRSKDMTNYYERHSIVLEHESALELKFKEGIEIGEKKGIEIGEKKGIEIGEKKGIEIGEKKGIEIGEKKGIEIGKIELARNFKNMGIPIDQIAKASGLREDEIEKL